MLVGVASVKVQKASKEKNHDITKTAGYREAMDDVKNGRVTTYDSLQDFYKEMGL
ncbi:MAG: U32 family peptidase [Prevotella sp.]|nr:U32 family peptidase [Prevotella sp.]